MVHRSQSTDRHRLFDGWHTPGRWGFLSETVRHIAVLMQPFVPEAAARILDQLGVGASERSFAHLTAAHGLKGGTTLPAPAGVFPRLGDHRAKAG